MRIDLTGKVALVTGASRGIGRASALALAEAGANVVINYRSHTEEAEAAAEACRATGPEAVVCQADIGDRGGCEQCVATAVEAFGRLDITVANAYQSIRKPAVEMSQQDMAVTWDTTLWHTFNICQLSAVQMIEQGEGGRLIAISSVHAAMAFLNSLAYNTAKAGINHMMTSFAGELAEHRILANSIEPGWIDTAGELNYSSRAELEAEGRKLPLGRLGLPEEIANMVVFLASDRADYITGSVLRVDGGYLLPRRH